MMFDALLRLGAVLSLLLTFSGHHIDAWTTTRLTTTRSTSCSWLRQSASISLPSTSPRHRLSLAMTTGTQTQTDDVVVDVDEEQTMAAMEAVVRRYFQGVTDKNATMIRSCFDASKGATIRDVCALSATTSTATDVLPEPVAARQVPVETMVERCMEFVAAHPDCVVQFHLEPTCLRQQQRQQQQQSDHDEHKEEFGWVFAHWYETGTWSGESCGLKPTNQPMQVEGQTRFRVRKQPPQTIAELVVTRTFTDWERQLLLLLAQK